MLALTVCPCSEIGSLLFSTHTIMIWILRPMRPFATFLEVPSSQASLYTLLHSGNEQKFSMCRYFPSRVTIKESSIAKIGSICRRVYRIFSHAYFHHRALFDLYEVRARRCDSISARNTNIRCVCTERDAFMPPLHRLCNTLQSHGRRTSDRTHWPATGGLVNGAVTSLRIMFNTSPSESALVHAILF